MSKNPCLSPVQVPHLTGKYHLFRCNRCCNCLKSRGNELTVRSIREYYGQSLYFLTFTYNDDMLPVMTSTWEVCRETGDVIFKKSYISRNSDSDFTYYAPYTWKVYIDSKSRHVQRLKRYEPYKVITQVDDDTDIIEVSYQTIYYEDIKNLFKRFRQRYPGALNKWICVPEYGGKSYRPHYHLMVFGLTKAQRDSLVIDWQSRFGKVDIQLIDNKADGVPKICTYLSKYACKGSFDCPYIFDGYCVKPRRGVSTGYGLGCEELYNDLKAKVLAWDVFGYYEPNEVNPDIFSERDCRLLAFRSSHITIGDYKYPFPKYLLRHIYNEIVYETDSESGEVVSRNRATALRKKIAKIILRDLVDRAKYESHLSDSLETFNTNFDNENSSDVCYDSESYSISTGLSKASFDADFSRRIEYDSIY